MTIIPKLSTAIATLALALGAAPAIAQQQQPQRPQVVTQFDDAMIGNLLRDVQATWTIERNAQGELNYRANAEGQINFTAAPRSCTEEAGCLGLMLIAVYSGVNAPSLTQLDAVIHSVNDASPTAKVYRTAEGLVILQAFINASYGISYRNAQNQLLLFGQNIVTVSRALSALERGG